MWFIVPHASSEVTAKPKNNFQENHHLLLAKIKDLPWYECDLRSPALKAQEIDKFKPESMGNWPV